MTQQYLRQLSLVVADQFGNGLDLGRLHCVFNVAHSTVSTPNTLSVRIYNLAFQTAQQVQNEFTQVILKAGYIGTSGYPPSGKPPSGSLATIFSGLIKQVNRGQENATDTFLDVFAADYDLARNWGLINTTLAAGYQTSDVVGVINGSLAQYGVAAGQLPSGLVQNAMPRGRPMFGMTRDEARTLARTYSLDWSIQNGKQFWWAFHPTLRLQPLPPGEALVINASTGMIGLPQQTQQGITVRILLNPLVGVGQAVQIANRLIQPAQADLSFAPQTPGIVPPGTPDTGPSANHIPQNSPLFPGGRIEPMAQFLSSDGTYEVIAVSHVGDTRGNDWYSDLTCLAVDTAILPGFAITPLGIPGSLKNSSGVPIVSGN